MSKYNNVWKRLIWTQKATKIKNNKAIHPKNKRLAIFPTKLSGNLLKLTPKYPKKTQNPNMATTTAPINNKGMMANGFFLSPGKMCLISGKCGKSASVAGLTVAGLTNVICNLANFHLMFSESNGPAAMTSIS